MKKLRNKKKIQFKKRIAVAMVGVTIATRKAKYRKKLQLKSKRLPKKQPQNQNLTQKLVNNQLNCRKMNLL